MALPAGITTCTVTIGSGSTFLGEDAVISGSIVADRNVVWAATGQAVYKTESTIPASMPGGSASFALPHVDQAGFVDAAGNAVTNWYYVFNGRATFDGNRIEPISKRFQVLVGQTTVDLDLVPDGPVIPGVTTPSAAVTSVNGQTGAVTVAGADNATVAGFVSSAGATKDALSASYAGKSSAYVAGHAYIVGELVTSGGTLLRVITNHTGGSTIDLTNFVNVGGGSGGGGDVDLSADLGPFAAGKGIILTSPDGTIVRRLRLNSSGSLVTDLVEDTDPGEDPDPDPDPEPTAPGRDMFAAAAEADSPLAFYSLDETSGTTAADRMGDHPGTYAGGYTLGAGGLLAGTANKAVTLDGSSGHVIVKSDGAIISGLTNWTVEAIVKTTGSGALYGERGSGGQDILRIDLGSNVVLTYRDHAGVISGAQSADSPPSNVPAHLAITKSGTTVKFYINGALSGTATLTSSDVFGESTTQSWIGADPTGAVWLPASVDEFVLYGTALLPAQVAVHFQATGITA